MKTTAAAPSSAPAPNSAAPDAAAHSNAHKKTIDAWLRGWRTRVRKTLGLALALGLAGGLLVIGQAALLAWVVNAIMLHRLPRTGLWPALAALLAVFALRAWAAQAAERSAFAAGATVRIELRARLLRHIHALGPAWLQWQAPGALANDVVAGIDALEGYYTRWLPQRALSALLPLAILAVVLPYDWVSALILLATAPLIPLFMILLGKGAQDLSQQQWRQLARLSARFLDTLQGLTTLKLFNASRREAALVARISEAYRESTMKVLRVAFLSAVVLEFLATVSIAMVAVVIGFHLLYGKIEFRYGFFVLLIVPEFYLPLRTLGTHYHARMEAIGAAERIMDVLALPLPPGPAQAGPGSAPQDAAPALHFASVSCAYTPGQTVLHELSFSAASGAITALVGPSGAGKSTVLQLLLGFATPCAGAILIDELALATLPAPAWLAQVAWVPQRAHVFAGSVLDNIRLARRDASLAQVRQAAQQAGAHDFIAALPQGYDTPLGERGAGLSGGEIQRLALARAFLKDAPVVLLDEPSANLDAHSQAHIHDAISRLAHRRTVLLVAHRLSTAQLAQHIVVLDGGRVAQSGTHAQLLAEGGLYARLAGVQAATV
jgi:ATP-binding cassette subfamily C protein CydD